MYEDRLVVIVEEIVVVLLDDGPRGLAVELRRIHEAPDEIIARADFVEVEDVFDLQIKNGFFGFDDLENCPFFDACGEELQDIINIDCLCR